MLVIIGAGGSAREVFHVVRSTDSQVDVGFVADWVPEGDNPDELGAPYLGTSQELTAFKGCSFVIGIGSGAARRVFDARATAEGLRPAEALVHPRADTAGRRVNLGPGAVVCSHVSMTENIAIGRHCHVNRNSTIGHDVTLGNYVTINPGVTISGRVTVGEEVLVGAGAVILETLSIGDGATVGAGAVVTRDVPAGATVVGVPAKPTQG